MKRSNCRNGGVPSFTRNASEAPQSRAARTIHPDCRRPRPARRGIRWSFRDRRAGRRGRCLREESVSFSEIAAEHCGKAESAERPALDRKVAQLAGESQGLLERRGGSGWTSWARAGACRTLVQPSTATRRFSPSARRSARLSLDRRVCRDVLAFLRQRAPEVVECHRKQPSVVERACRGVSFFVERPCSLALAESSCGLSGCVRARRARCFPGFPVERDRLLQKGSLGLIVAEEQQPRRAEECLGSDTRRVV